MSDNLKQQVKRKLNITWQDEDTDARVADIMESASVHLRHELGITDINFDFSAPGIENLLFKNYCFYEWNHALNEFEENYRSLIMDARAKYEVEQYRESEDMTDDTEQASL